METTVTVPLPADLAEWLKREAARQDRPKAYIARKALEIARAQTERAAA